MRICGKCGGRNDDTRALCRDCGTVLTTANSKTVKGEAPAVGDAGLAAPSAAAEVARREARKRLRKAGPRFRISSLVPWIVLLLLAGGVYLAIQPPEVPVVPGQADSPVLLEFFRKAAGSKEGAITVREQDVNAFLAGAVRVAPSVPYADGKVEFVGCAATLGDGGGSLGMEQSYFGRRIVFRIGFEPTSLDGGSGVRWTGGSIGRLEVPAFAAPAVAVFFRPVFECLDPVLGDLRRARSIEISPGRAVVRWP